MLFESISLNYAPVLWLSVSDKYILFVIAESLAEASRHRDRALETDHLDTFDESEQRRSIKKPDRYIEESEANDELNQPPLKKLCITAVAFASNSQYFIFCEV